MTLYNQNDKTENVMNQIHSSISLGQRCTPYNGIHHPNRMNKCCASACGEFCGAVNCNDGPGVSGSCCGSTILDEDLCGSVKDTAPCTLGKIRYSNRR